MENNAVLVLNWLCLVPRPPPFFVLQFVFSIIHGSTSVYYTEHKPKNKKRGRPGNEAIIGSCRNTINDLYSRDDTVLPSCPPLSQVV